MPTWHFSKPMIPVRAVVLSVAALAVPFVASLWAAEAAASPLIWLVALIPAFLLAYYRGWRGVATALAAAMATLALSNVMLLVRGGTIDELLLLGVISVFIATCLGIGWLSDALHRKRSDAELVALTDELTGLPNRRRIKLFLETQVAGAAHGTLTVVMFDLDNFKAYNDQHGHSDGDIMLRMFAGVLHSHLPPKAMAGRYGGEEFLVTLPGCEESEGVRFAERVRLALSATQVSIHPLTVCGGVATGRVGSTANELIVAADRALYRAKQNGRNCVCSASEVVAVAS
jgi:diguanylate cyclase (GGDEF)-like protein